MCAGTVIQVSWITTDVRRPEAPIMNPAIILNECTPLCVPMLGSRNGMISYKKALSLATSKLFLPEI